MAKSTITKTDVSEAILDLIAAYVHAGQLYLATRADCTFEEFARLIEFSPLNPSYIESVLALASDPVICGLADRRAPWPDGWPEETRTKVHRAIGTGFSETARILGID